MPNYRRLRQPADTYFFTIVSFNRNPWLCQEPARIALRRAIQFVRSKRPFEIDAWVLLPDHFHCMLTFPTGKDDYSAVMKSIKAKFTKDPLTLPFRSICGSVSESRMKKSEKNIWQRRFWDHAIRDEKDYEIHFNYIHYNPVKHGLSKSPSGWPHSTFHRYVEKGYYSPKWASGEVPEFPEIDFGE